MTDRVGHALRRGGGSLSSLMRMFFVAAIGVAAVDAFNQLSPALVLGGPHDATAFVINEMQMLGRVSLKLMSLGHDVVVFLGIA